MIRFAIVLGLLAPAVAAAEACFCDPRTQEFDRPSALECLAFTPIEGCVKVTITNGCSTDVVLKAWPAIGMDVSIPAGEGRTVLMYAQHQTIPETTDFPVTLSGKAYTLVHRAQETCGACSAGGRPAAPEAWVLLLPLLLLMTRRRRA